MLVYDFGLRNSQSGVRHSITYDQITKEILGIPCVIRFAIIEIKKGFS